MEQKLLFVDGKVAVTLSPDYDQTEHADMDIIICNKNYKNYTTYKQLKEAHPGKLFIFISHAESSRPEGRAAKMVEYDADIKIFFEGFKASCKSHFMDRPGVPFIIW